MRKKILFLLISWLALQPVNAQNSILNKKISADYQNKSAEEILNDISKKHSIYFYYNASIPDLKKSVSIKANHATLESILSKLFPNSNLTYKAEGNKVMISPTSKTKIKTTIHGYVIDAESKETLIGANVMIGGTTIGTATNTFGFYSLTFHNMPSEILFSFAGYKDTTVLISNSYGGVDINISLTPETTTMQEVVVTSESTVLGAQTSYHKLPISDVKALPSFMGEKDIIKTMQLMPGIKSGDEATSGFYVRGGGPDQNLVLLDGSPLYNTSHSLNLFSVFNPDATKAVEIYKGGFPARYGGRLSSVLDVTLKDGNMEKHLGEASIGFLKSKATIEGPIVKNKSSYIISVRRSTIDLLARILQNVSSSDSTSKLLVAFHDVCAKLNYKFSERDRVFASFYGSGDGIDIGLKVKVTPLSYAAGIRIKWNNYNGAFRWNHVFSGKLFSNTTLTYSKFNLSFNTGIDLRYQDLRVPDYSYSNKFSSIIDDLGIRSDFDYFPDSRHSIKFGASARSYKFQPGISTYHLQDAVSSTDTIYKDRYNSSVIFAYVEDEIDIISRLKANVGMHASTLTTTSKTRLSLQPRIAVIYRLSFNQSIKASYSKMNQNIHLLTTSGQVIPFDLWVPASDKAPPMNAHQYNIGYALEFFAKEYEFSAESYYKQMSNLIEYKDGANFSDGSIPWDQKIHTGGKGKSYGLELLLRKKQGIVTGWVGYTLSKVDRSFKEINNGKAFPYKFDRRHDLSVVSMYKLSDKISLSGTWVFTTGNAFTFPEGTYPMSQNLIYPSSNIDNSNSIQYFNGRNMARMPNYHRLDLAIDFKKTKAHGVRTWNISIYNVYARQSPFFIYATTDSNGNRKMKQVSMYSIFPSITYSFKFI